MNVSKEEKTVTTTVIRLDEKEETLLRSLLAEIAVRNPGFTGEEKVFADTLRKELWA